MQTWQLFPIVIVVAVGVYVAMTRGKMRQAAADMYTSAIGALRAACDAQRRAGETAPVCVVALTRSTFKARVFFVGLTNQRLFIAEHGQETRAFDRGPGLSLAIRKKTFADSGNMQTTYSDGWEAKVALPGGESHVWRLYGTWEGYAEQPANLQAFLVSTGAA